jgi:error-prone DNA polymerase
VQKSPEGVVHLMAERLVDRSADLKALMDFGETPPPARAGHPRNVRVLPPSRDFH